MTPGIGLFDRAFLISESSETPQHVSCLAVFRLPDGAEPEFVQRLAEQMASQRDFQHPFDVRLRRPALKSVAPSLERVDPAEIDLDFHFRRSALPTPGGERELGVLISRLHSRPLDLTKPLWECHLIEGLEDGRFALFVKVHHAIMDGIGGIRRLQRMMSTDPLDTAARAIWTVPSRRLRAVGPTDVPAPRREAGTARTRLREQGEFLRVGGALVRDSVRGDADRATPFALPRTRINGRIGQQRRVATQTFDFARVRSIADRADVSINDVFLSLCSGALRRYLGEADELPERSLIAGTPVSVRSDAADASNNAFTITTMKLCTDVDDPVRRVQAIRESANLAKSRLAGLSKTAAEQYGALVTLPHLLQNLVGLGGRVRPPYNVVISNVPGPLEPQYLAGAPLERLTPFGVLYHGVGLMIIAVTASERMSIGFIGDRDSLPHLQRIAVYTADELEALEAALGAAAPASDAHRPRARRAPKS